MCLCGLVAIHRVKLYARVVFMSVCVLLPFLSVCGLWLIVCVMCGLIVCVVLVCAGVCVLL